MDSSATASGKAKTARKDYVASFANLVAAFTSSKIEDLLAQIPSLLVNNFDADRAELWLWDTSSDSAYLVHHAGMDGARRHDYAASGAGVIGKVGQAKKLIENIGLATFGGEDQEFSKRTGLSHISAYPLMVANKPMAVLAIYSSAPATKDLLGWWRMYAEMCG